MADSLDHLTDAVRAIQSDKQLTDQFVRILSIGSFTQQVRVSKLQEAVQDLDPPKVVTDVLKMLGNDQLAAVVLEELSKS